MKNRLFNILWTVLLCFSSLLLEASETYIHTLHFNKADLSLSNVQIGGQQYTQISLGEFHNQGDPGNPSLPWTVFSVSVPPEADNFSVSVSGSVPQIYSLNHNPLPIQYDIPTSLDYGSPPFAPLAPEYTSGSTPYPTVGAVVSGVQNIGGFNRVVTIAVTPFSWCPSSKQLTFQEEMRVALTWEPIHHTSQKLMYPCYQDIVRQNIDLARETVVNPYDVATYEETIAQLNESAASVSPENQIHYIIVTTRHLAPAFDRLAALRRLRGVRTKIFCIEDILIDQRFKDGDTVSNINDEAGKLRAFLQDCYINLGTQYVLLAGPFPDIPARKAKYTDRKANKVVEFYSNAYYSHFYIKWNNMWNDKIIWAYEIENNIALLKVGRLTVTSNAQVNTYIDKLINYEFLPDGMDPSYLNMAYAMIGEDSTRETWDGVIYKGHLTTTNYNDYQRPVYRSHFTKLTEAYADSLVPYYGQAAMADISKRRYGYIDLIGHGHWEGVATYIAPNNSAWYGINALDDYQGGFVSEPQNGLDNLGNAGYPSWSLSMSCNIGDIGTDCETLTFAESYLFGGDYGGVLLFCPSGPGYFRASNELNQAFFNRLIECYMDGLTIPYGGTIDLLGRVDYCNASRFGDYNVLAHHYVAGDPLTMIWAKAPRRYITQTGIHIVEGLADNDFVYTGWQNLSNGRTYMDKQPLSLPMSASPLNNEIRTYYRADMRPFIVPVNLVDWLVESNGYIVGGDVKIGYPAGVSTSFRLSKDVEYTIESISKIDIEADIRGKQNSCLNLKSREYMTFSDCTICTGTSVRCNSKKEVILDRGTVIDAGAVFEAQGIIKQ